MVTKERCITVTEEQRTFLENRTPEEESAVVSPTFFTAVTPCQSQETGEELKGAPAANSHTGRHRKNKRRTTKKARQAKESPVESRSIPEAVRGTLRSLKSKGSHMHVTQSAVEPAEAFVIDVAGAKQQLCCPVTEETQLPIKPVSGSGGDGNPANRKAVASPATIIEKQEGENWEVELLISDTESLLDKSATERKGN